MTIRHLLAVAVLLLAPAFVAAADKPAPAGGEAAAKHADGHDENPAAFIDIHRYDLGIYTLIVFGLLFLVLAKFAWGPFSEGLRKREADLIMVRDAAEKARRDAEAAQARLNAEFAAANDKIRAMLEEARRDADALRAKEREAGQKDAAAERDRAIREIQSERDAAKQEIYQLSVDLATLISTKAVRKSMTADDHRRLVDEALGEMKASARN